MAWLARNLNLKMFCAITYLLSPLNIAPGLGTNWSGASLEKWIVRGASHIGFAKTGSEPVGPETGSEARIAGPLRRQSTTKSGKIVFP